MVLVHLSCLHTPTRSQKKSEKNPSLLKYCILRLHLKPERFNLGQTMTNIVTDFRKQTNDGSVSILYDAHDLIVYADRDKISQVIHNLISNAVKFTKSGSIVVSVMEQKDKYIVVEVKDTGKGIDPEVLPSLFTKFVTKSDKGTGLGLYISKGIVEAHGGRIWAENNNDGEGEGKGARFYFSLPKDPNRVNERSK
jgi:two-component system sensor histidine kinase VicK